jgi:glycolate oxidase
MQRWFRRAPERRGAAARAAVPPDRGHLVAAHADLTRLLGDGEVLVDPLALALYARDASMIEGGCALVAFPRSREHVVGCLRVARERGLEVVPRGAGTGLAGAATPTGDALVLTTVKMTRILEVRPADRLAWVEPGVLNLDLVNHLTPLGYTFAPDPSSQQTSTVGGNVATNAGGPHCLALGVTSNHVLGVELAMPEGPVVRLGAEGPEAPGYDLRGLVVGSEGMLGVVTAVCVRLTPLPPAVRTMLIGFDTVAAAADTVAAVIAAGVVPAAMELMDRPIIGLLEAYVHAGYPTDAEAVLLVEVDGLPGGVEAEAALIERIAADHGHTSLQVATDDEHRARIWKGRKSSLGAVSAIAPHYYLHDTVVPRARLTEALAAVYEITERHRLKVVNMFHAGDGNLHPLLLFDRAEPGVLDRVLEASEEIVRLCVELGGSLSGEHGIGLEKRDLMPMLFSGADLDAQACVRGAFDPDGRMNPRKVLPSGAKCGDYALARGGAIGEALAGLPEGSWV